MPVVDADFLEAAPKLHTIFYAGGGIGSWMTEAAWDRGITVTAVCPGVTRTSFFDVAGAPGWLQKHSSLTVETVVKAGLKALWTKFAAKDRMQAGSPAEAPRRL